MSPEDHWQLQDPRIREFDLALDSPEPYAQFAANFDGRSYTFLYGALLRG
jgi:hypothetical protein